MVEKVKLHHTHKNRIRKLYKERFGLNELYIMYKEKIPYSQLREIVKGIKRNEKV